MALTFQTWIDYRGDLIPETIALIDNLNRQKTPVFAFTDGTTRISEEISQHNLQNKFRKVLISADFGYKKPDPRAFFAAHQQLEAHLCTTVEPASVIFMDDRPSNTKAAKNFGWQAITFESVKDLANVLPRITADTAQHGWQTPSSRLSAVASTNRGRRDSEPCVGC